MLSILHDDLCRLRSGIDELDRLHHSSSTASRPRETDTGPDDGTGVGVADDHAPCRISSTRVSERRWKGGREIGRCSPTVERVSSAEGRKMMDSRLDPGCGLVERIPVGLGEILREVVVGQVEVALST